MDQNYDSGFAGDKRKAFGDPRSAAKRQRQPITPSPQMLTSMPPQSQQQQEQQHPQITPISPSVVDDHQLPYWRGSKAAVWMQTLKTTLDLELAALTPRQLQTHPKPEVVLGGVRLWFQNLKRRPDLTLRDHLRLLDDAACVRCFHPHPPAEKCFCPCWLKIVILLTNDVAGIYDAVDSDGGGVDNRRETTPTRTSSTSSMITVGASRSTTAAPPGFEVDPANVERVAVGGARPTPPANGVADVRPADSSLGEADSSDATGAEGNDADGCADPFFVTILKIDATIDPFAILEARKCHNCLETQGDSEGHGVEGDYVCPPDGWLCLNCFHHHARLSPCKCDCHRVALREAVPNLDFERIMKWNYEKRCGGRFKATAVVSSTTHPPPPFAAFLLKNPAVDVGSFVDNAFCDVCLLSTHRTDVCENDYVCLTCFHQHHPQSAQDCNCVCVKQHLAKVLVFNARDLEETERRRRKRDDVVLFLQKRKAARKLAAETKPDDGQKARDIVAGKSTSTPSSSSQLDYEEIVDADDEEIVHVIPKFVICTMRKYKNAFGRLPELVRPFLRRPTPLGMCLLCLMRGHSTGQCTDGFLCLNCFHSHKMGLSCRCFCYLTSLTKDAVMSGRDKVGVMNTLQEINSTRRSFLENEGFKPVVVLKVKETELGLPAPTPTRGNDRPAPVVAPTPATAAAPVPDEDPASRGQITFTFVFPNIDIVTALTVERGESVASLKSALLNAVQKVEGYAKTEGDMILYDGRGEMDGSGKGQSLRLVDGKRIADYNFKGANKTLTVEFRDDVVKFQKDQEKWVRLSHPAPPFLDAVFAEPLGSMKKKFKSACLNCMAGEHGTADCEKGFFCLGCFHVHKMQYPCTCKCLKYHAAKVMDAANFDLRLIERWNCNRIKRICDIRKETAAAAAAGK